MQKNLLIKLSHYCLEYSKALLDPHGNNLVIGVFAESVWSSECFTASLDPCNISMLYNKNKGSSEYSTASLNPYGNSLACDISIVYNEDKGSLEHTTALLESYETALLMVIL